MIFKNCGHMASGSFSFSNAQSHTAVFKAIYFCSFYEVEFMSKDWKYDWYVSHSFPDWERIKYNRTVV